MLTAPPSPVLSLTGPQIPIGNTFVFLPIPWPKYSFPLPNSALYSIIFLLFFSLGPAAHFPLPISALYSTIFLLFFSLGPAAHFQSQPPFTL